MVHDLSLLHHKNAGTIASHVQPAVLSLQQRKNLRVGQSIRLRQDIRYLSVLHKEQTIRGAGCNGTVRQLQGTSDTVTGDLRKCLLLITGILPALLQTNQAVLTV